MQGAVGLIAALFVLIAFGDWLQKTHPNIETGIAWAFVIVVFAVFAWLAFWALKFLYICIAGPILWIKDFFDRPPKPSPVPVSLKELPHTERWELAKKSATAIMAEFPAELPYEVSKTMMWWAVRIYMNRMRSNIHPDDASRYVRAVLTLYLSELPPLPEHSYLSVPLSAFVTPDETTDYYEDLYEAKVPYLLPHRARTGGMWIAAEPDAGKTNLLHCMIEHDMREVADRKASIIMMDSKSNDPMGLVDTWRAIDFKFTWNIENAYVFDPEDKLAINIFDLGNADNIVDLLEYIFSAFFKTAEFTSYQSLLLTKCVLVVKHSPKPSILALYDLLSKGSRPFEAAIRKLRPHDQDFFLDRRVEGRGNKKVAPFDSSQYADTRQGVLSRLDMLLSRSTILYETLASEETRLNLRQLIDQGSVIIISGKPTVLSDKGVEFWQRLWTMMLLDAGRRRQNDIPVYCYIDEAKTLANDTKLADIFDELRAANVCMTIAHQRRGQMALVRDALEDRAIIFRGDNELPVGSFKATIRRHFPKPVVVSVDESKVKRLPTLSQWKADEARERTRARFSVSHPVPAFRRPEPEYAQPDVDAAPFIIEREHDSAEQEPEPFKYTDKLTISDAEYTIIKEKPEPAASGDDPIIRDILERYRLLPEPPQPKSLPSPPPGKSQPR